MTSPLDKAPYEVLECIVKHLHGHDKDLRQLQLTNKRFQSIAEKYLFEELILSCRVDAEYMMRYAQLIMKPERCKLVKRLWIDEKRFIALTDCFFDTYCNIEKVNFNHCDGMNWQNFSKTFTSERCRLREIPYPPDESSEVEFYLDALQDHSGTVEKLDFTEVSDTISTQLLKAVSKSCNFPRLKEFLFIWRDPRLKELDVVINKCPTLEEFELILCMESDVGPWIPTTQHHRQLKNIHLFSSSAEFINMCTYLTSKFPNVGEWDVTNFASYTVEEEKKIADFEEYVDIFHLMMKKAMKVVLAILITYSSLSRVLDFLELYKINTNISIEYQPPHVSFFDVSKQKEDGLDMLIVRLRYSRSQSILEDNMSTIIYISDGLPHFGLLETIGHCIQTLKILLPLHEYAEQESMDIQRMIQGGALVHLLNNCTALISVEYSADTLKFALSTTGSEINKSLKQMVLQCETIDKHALSSLSRIAPAVVDLTIKSRFIEMVLNNDSRQILINMPENSFDRLVLQDIWWYEDSKPWGSILVQIISTVTPGVKYYVQKCYEDEKEAFASVSDEQEYNSCSKLPHTKIRICCHSIKYVEYSVGVIGNTRCVFKVFT